MRLLPCLAVYLLPSRLWTTGNLFTLPGGDWQDVTRLVRLRAHLVRGDQNRDDRHHDEYQDHEDEAEHHSAHRPPAQVRADDPSCYPQHAVELLVPQVRATAIGPATCRIGVIRSHGLSMGFSQRARQCPVADPFSGVRGAARSAR